MPRFDVFALLKSALAIGGAVESAVLCHKAVAAVQGALGVESLIFDDLHKKASL